MAAISELSMFESLFQSALEEFEKETGINLVGHSLATQLKRRNSVESITEFLYDQARNFHQFRGNDNKLVTALKHTVQELHMLSGIVTVGGAVGFQVPFVELIHTGIGVLLSAVQDIDASYDALVNLLETICNFLRRLEIYTVISPTPAMTEIIVKILIQLISILAVATKQVKEGQLKKFVKKLFGENDVEMVLHRLDRLTLDESRATGAQTLEVVHGLVKNLREVMSDREVSTYDIQTALEIMQHVVNGMNEPKRQQVRQNVRSWLSPPDPWENYRIGRETHHDGTARWFIQGDTFAAWRSSSDPLLWIHGKPGAGKSLLCSSIIEEINRMRVSGLASLGLYYFDFRDDEKKHPRGLLSSLLLQLCDQSATYCDILSRLYSTQRNGSQSPSDSDLVRCLEDMLRSPGQAPVYLVIDALDDCPDSSYTPSPRENVLKLAEVLANLELPNLRICLTSRPEVDIKAVLDRLMFRSISLHDEEGQKQDILDYITSVVHSDPRMRRWRAEDKKRVIDELSQKANGMFRWVFCKLDFLRRCLPTRIQRALAELPTTLDYTYERTLLEISEANWESAHRLLQYVVVACRPLHIEELAEFLAFDFNTGPIPEFHERFRPADPIHSVLSTCPSLLSVVNAYGSEVVQFSHFSVMEYLMSARLAEDNDITSRRYHVSMTGAHTIAAQACLGILLHLDENVDSNSLKRFPLAKYAADHWVDHVQLEDVSQRVEAGLKQLFDPRKPHLAIWLSIHDLAHRLIDQGAYRWPSWHNGSWLHYAALCGLHRIIEFLVTEHRQEVNSLGFEDKSTPLHAAVQGPYSGAVSVTRVLLKLGADPMAWNKDGHNPLHLAAGSSSSHAMEVIRALVEGGADPMAWNKDGHNPLHLVAGSSSSQAMEVIRALVEVGADPMAWNKDGRNPLHVAVGSEFPQTMAVVRTLIEAGADATARDKDGHNALHEAARSSSSRAMEVVRVLMETDADSTANDEHGRNPLHFTPALSSQVVVRALIEAGADPTAHDEHGRNPLHFAAALSSQAVIRALIEPGADATAQDKDGRNPLHVAAGSESPQAMAVVQALIEAGADAMVQDKDGRNSLHFASHRGNVEAVQMLLERGADPTAQDKDGQTPVHCASQYGHLSIVSSLIARGADVDTRGNDNCTPLHRASQHGHLEVVRVLLEQGTDVNSRDHCNWTPLHGASQHGHTEVVQLLLEHGASTNALDLGGWTPLQLPSCGGYLRVLRVLLEHGAEANTRDHSNWTPLHGASQQGHMEVVQALLEHGADTNSQDDRNQTPLHLASRAGYLGIVQLLIEHNASVSARNDGGRTPSQEASEKGHDDVVQLLLEHGSEQAFSMQCEIPYLARSSQESKS